MRRQSIGHASYSSETIEEGSEDEDADNGIGPGPHIQKRTHVRAGSATGAGTGVSVLSSSSSSGGLPLRPKLGPAGGSQRHIEVSSMANPDVAYGEDAARAAEEELGAILRSSSDRSIPTRNRGILRTYSMAQQKRRPQLMNDDRIIRQRRLSHDAIQESPRRFIVDVEETLQLVLEQEDTDGNFQISVDDSGPKVVSLGTATSNGYKGVDIRGHYMLSNLLQELALAREHGRKRIVLDESRLNENPVDRLSRMISQTFWHNLTRRIDGSALERILNDPKNRSKSQVSRRVRGVSVCTFADHPSRTPARSPHASSSQRLKRIKSSTTKHGRPRTRTSTSPSRSCPRS